MALTFWTRFKHEMTVWAFTAIIDWWFDYHHSHGLTSLCGINILASVSCPWHVRFLIQWLQHKNPACKCPYSHEQSDWKWDICCAQWRLFSRERTALLSRIHHPLLFLLSSTPTRVLPLEYENILSLIEAPLNYSLFVIVFSGCGRWDLDMKWNYWRFQDGQAGTNKSRLSLFTGEVWEQPHYTVARINLGPLFLPFTLGAWYNVLQAS